MVAAEEEEMFLYGRLFVQSRTGEGMWEVVMVLILAVAVVVALVVLVVVLVVEVLDVTERGETRVQSRRKVEEPVKGLRTRCRGVLIPLPTVGRVVERMLEGCLRWVDGVVGRTFLWEDAGRRRRRFK